MNSSVTAPFLSYRAQRPGERGVYKIDGRFIEEIGTYDPTQEPSVYKVDEEAAKKWLANGAQPTEVVAKIFKLAGIEK